MTDTSGVEPPASDGVPRKIDETPPYTTWPDLHRARMQTNDSSPYTTWSDLHQSRMQHQPFIPLVLNPYHPDFNLDTANKYYDNAGHHTFPNMEAAKRATDVRGGMPYKKRKRKSPDA
jgi:hypothetical protein